jgi:hypothetical protein
MNKFEQFIDTRNSYLQLKEMYEQKKEQYNSVHILALEPSKSLERTSFGTFDTETKDGLIGKELFCWSFCYTKERESTLSVIQSTDETLAEFFTFFEERCAKVKQKDKERENTAKSSNLFYKLPEYVVYIQNNSFDERFIRKELVKRNYKYHVIMSGSNVLALQIPELKLRIIDTLQFLQTSQEKAEIEYNIDENLRKIDCKDLFTKKFECWSEADKQRVIEHNKNDVLALHDIMSQIREIIYHVVNVDILKEYSVSSIAIKGWRKNLRHTDNPYKALRHTEILKKREGIKIEGIELVNPFLFEKYEKGKRTKYMLSEIEADFCRSAYYGGRCEVFNTNRVSNAAYFDKVSMYAYCLAEKEYPTGNAEWVIDEDILMNIINGKDQRLGVIRARVIPNKSDKYPLLPYKYEEKVIFDCKEKTGIWSSVELVEAYRKGYDIFPDIGFIFESKAFIFQYHCRELFKLKQNSVGGRKANAKLLNNSLYGKTGQDFHHLQYDTVFFDTLQDCCVAFDDAFNKKQKITAMKEFPEVNKYGFDVCTESISMKPFQNVVLALFCTAYSRLELQSFIDILAEHNIEIYYCDTDSLTCKLDKEILQYLQIGKELGNWQIEKEFIEVQFFAPKIYASIEQDKSGKRQLKMKMKGLDQDTLKKKLLLCKSMDDIEGVFKNHVLVAEERYSTLRLSAAHGAILYSHVPKKSFSFINDKRKVLVDGSTIPWGYAE